MTYQETLDYLYRQMPEYQRIGHLAYKPGLGNSLQLDELFGHPHRKFKTIHVGGTNGKGSISHLLAAVLRQSGYNVGLYTSPHLIDFRERIRVNGEMIDKQYVIDFVEKYRSKFEPVMPSFFELSMEMAFLYFAEQKVDVAVIEVGLGGRLDSTNIISPDLSIITNIGFDHMKYLGNTLPKIADEKAGIIKPHTPVVIGEIEQDDVQKVFVDKAKSVEAKIIFAEKAMPDYSAQPNNGKWLIQSNIYRNLTNELGGFAQEKNSKTVLVAIEELRTLGYNIPTEAVYKGFENVTRLTGLMGRWQVLQEKPKVISDTGHNAHGIRYVARQLETEKYHQLRIVIGMSNDKDVDAVLSLLPKHATCYFTRASVDRALDEKILATKASGFGLKGDAFHTVADAVAAAKNDSADNDLIFIGGSNFVVADALPLFFPSIE